MAENETPESERLADPVKNAIDYAATKFEGAASTDRNVTLQRTASLPTDDQVLWAAIRNRTDALSFRRYSEFIDRVLCKGEATLLGEGEYGEPSLTQRRTELNEQRPSIHGVDAYNLLKLATEVFLIFECGVVKVTTDVQGTKVITLPHPELTSKEQESNRFGESVTLGEIESRLVRYLRGANNTVLPYLGRIVTELAGLNGTRGIEVLPYCDGILKHRVTCPSLLELIWSYWHEQGMLVQAMNALSLRFQNKRGGMNDPLANLEIDPLRPLNNLLWGFVQDEYNRLTVQRRSYEYDHQYGLTLYGKAVAKVESADSRSKFLEAFHNLLYRTAVFYREDADTTVVSDGFPLLNTLKEVHLQLSEGAHNQFGDLPWTARTEMLTMQWLLARPEMREFLRGRAMVPYREPWMGAIDAMKRLQGWTDTSVSQFRDLGVFGEQILLSVRYGDWIDVNDQEQARNWARYWKPEIQSYLHAYFAVTGVDLSAEMTDSRRAADRYLQPSIHLRNRLAEQRTHKQLTTSRIVNGTFSTETFEYHALPAYPRHRLLRHQQDD
jgi:hypothetical protein